MTPEEIVSKQLDYYNAHDIEGFCSMYADGVELLNFGEKTPYVKSKSELRDFYTKRFANVKLKARIANRMTKGPFVIDNERVVGIGETELDLIAVYEVGEDLIQKVWFIRN